MGHSSAFIFLSIGSAFMFVISLRQVMRCELKVVKMKTL